MPIENFRVVHEIEYTEDITERKPITGQPGYFGFYGVTIGKRRMRCRVRVSLDVNSAAGSMGARACRSKGGKCQDGPVIVERIGTPQELSREMKPHE